MPANWGSFIPDVKDLILSNPESPKIFGEKLARHYVSAVTSGASSIFGQQHSDTSGKSNLVSKYGEWFQKLKDEEIDPPINNEIDDSGDEIPYSGKESDPEFTDPDMTESEEPIIDLEKFNKFIEDYSAELDLHKFKHFEFNLKGGESHREIRDIIIDRLMVSLSTYSGENRVKFVRWVASFGTWLSSNANVYQRNLYRDGVINTLSGYELETNDFLKDVRLKFLDMLKVAYEATSNSDIEGLIKGTPVNPIQILNKTIKFRRQVIQEEYDESREGEEGYNVSELLNAHVITYFTFSGSSTSSAMTANSIESYYIAQELKGKWQKSPDVSSKEDIMNKTGGTLYMYTRQEMINGMDESDDDGKPDAYKEIAKATIEYWKATGPQPLGKTPAAFPCMISSPLGGKYIPIYYGGVSKLAEDIRKAMNSGKESNNADAAAFKVAKALSLAYTRHLLQMKFVYLGGIPTLGGNMPMIGFVPNVF